MKFANLCKITKTELVALLHEKKKELLSFNFARFAAEGKFSTAKMKELRKDIARIFTALSLLNKNLK